jgi:hypothetical protein
MCTLLDIPRNLNDLSFHKEPATADDDCPIADIQINEVLDERTAGHSV